MTRSFLFMLLVIPFSCWAHNTHDQPSIINGILHPFTGWDHMFALLAIGWITFQHKGFLNSCAIPLTFILGLLFGATLGTNEIAPKGIEFGIATSLMVFGALIAFKVPTKNMWPLILGAGIFHGFAHGAEMPANSSALMYFSGFTVSSAILLSLGFKAHQHFSNSIAIQKIRKMVAGVLLFVGTLLLLGLT